MKLLVSLLVILLVVSELEARTTANRRGRNNKGRGNGKGKNPPQKQPTKPSKQPVNQPIQPSIQPIVNKQGVFVLHLHNYNNEIYKGKVSLGNPSQSLEVMFEIADTLTWFPSTNCISKGSHIGACKNENLTYNFEKSSTNVPEYGFALQRHGSLIRGDGQGHVDTIKLGSPSEKETEIGQIYFGAVSNVTEYDYGVIGLTYMEETDTPLFMKTVVEDKVFAEPKFTMHLKRCDQADCKDGGQIVFGDDDKQNCEPVKEWFSTDDYFYPSWTLNSTAIQFKPQKGASLNFQIKNAVLYSSRSFIELNEQHFNALTKKFGVKEQQNGVNMVGCGTKMQLKINVGQSELVLDEKTLVLRKLTTNNNQCQLAIQKTKETQLNEIGLGMPLLRSYCVTIHQDEKERKIGFGKVKNP